MQSVLTQQEIGPPIPCFTAIFTIIPAVWSIPLIGETRQAPTETFPPAPDSWISPTEIILYWQAPR